MLGMAQGFSRTTPYHAKPCHVIPKHEFWATRNATRNTKLAPKVNGDPRSNMQTSKPKSQTQNPKIIGPTQDFHPNTKFSPQPKIFATTQKFRPHTTIWPKPKIFAKTQNVCPNTKIFGLIDMKTKVVRYDPIRQMSNPKPKSPNHAMSYQNMNFENRRENKSSTLPFNRLVYFVLM